jgi:hypothetical protein
VTPDPAAGKPDWPQPAGGLQRFYLGCPEPSWLRGEGVGWLDGTQGLALFVSHRRLARLRTLPRAGLPWACDSGSFTELRAAGRRRVSPVDYTRAVARYDREIGLLEWTAPMDWMFTRRASAPGQDYPHGSISIGRWRTTCCCGSCGRGTPTTPARSCGHPGMVCRYVICHGVSSHAHPW